MQILVQRSTIPTPVGAVEVPYIQADPWSTPEFVHAFSTRLGGVSPCPQSALNLDYTIDSPSNVDENKRRFLATIGCVDWPVLNSKQIHSSKVEIVSKVSEWPDEGVEADAIITTQKGVLLGVRTADCLPILIANPKQKIAAVIHAGWRGTVEKITEKTIETLEREFGTTPEDCLALMGPCACADCYEVRADVFGKFEETFGPGNFLKWKNPGESAFLDLRGANQNQLLKMAFDPAHIVMSSFCTIHQNDLFFSHRVEGRQDPLKVGRMLAVIGIKP